MSSSREQPYIFIMVWSFFHNHILRLFDDEGYSRIRPLRIESSNSRLFSVSPTILPMLLSDHSLIIFSLDNFLGPAKVKRWRFNTTLLQNKDFLTCICERVKEFIQHNAQSEVNPHILWESTKCHISGVCISFSSHLNRTRREKLEEAAQEIGFLESQQKLSYTEDRQKLLSAAKSMHNVFLLHRQNFFIWKPLKNITNMPKDQVDSWHLS